MFTIEPYEARMRQALEHFVGELKKVRTGRAHPDMLEGVMIEAYGAHMPLNQVGNVVAADAQLLQITPFDPANLKAIGNAIRDNAALGLNPSDDGRVVRVPIPPLTAERRQQLAKQLGDKAEECRVSMSAVRHDALRDIKTRKEAKEFGDDQARGFEKRLDDLIANFQTEVEAALKAKETEITTL